MKTPLILLFLLLPLLALAQPLEPYRHNFFTTNPAPVVDVVAGSNTVVTPSLIGTSTRRFTVSATATPAQTNFSYSAITNAPWQWGTQNLTNWSQLSTNELAALTNGYPWTNLTVAYAGAVTNGYPWTNLTVAYAGAVTNGYPWTNLTVAYAGAVTNGYPWTNLTVSYAGAVTNGYPWTNIYSPGISGGSTNQVYTQTGWSGYPQITNLSIITNGIGATVVPSLWLTNPTPASLGAQQNSPVLMQAGQGWRSGNSTTMPVAMGWGVVPVQGSSVNPIGKMTLYVSVSNAVPSSTTTCFFDSGGNIGLFGALYINPNAALTTYDAVWGSSFYGVKSAWQLKWSSTTQGSGTADTGLARNAAGVVEVDNGTAGTLATLLASNITASATVTATNGYVHQLYATNGYTVCTQSKQFYLVNAYTNPLFVLPDASTVTGKEFVFSTTNNGCFFIVTNATGAQPIANGQYLSYTNQDNGIKVVRFISDGAAWWLSSKGRVTLPSASWSCNTNITFPNVTNMVTLDTQEANNGVGIALDNSAWYTAGVGSRIWVTNAGMYLLTFSAMWSKVGGGAANGDVWLRQDGAMLPRTMTLQTIQNATTTNVMTVNFILPVTKTTYFDLVGASPDGTAQMQAMPAITTPFARPAAPSMIVTIQKTSD